MSSIQLLDKTRKINKLLHNNASAKFVFSDICTVVGEVLQSNVLVISKSGKVLGMSNYGDVKIIREYLCESVGMHIEEELNNRLLEILSTKENVNLTTLGFEYDENKNYFAIITPIDIAGERLGTLFIYRTKKSYDIDDIILSEYGTTVVGLEMIRSVSEEKADVLRNREALDFAIQSLSASERKAIAVVLEKLGKREGVIIASKVSAEAGITRSVIVNAIRKFEGAGLIQTHSNGMKGTYIKVLNENIFNWIKTMEK